MSNLAQKIGLKNIFCAKSIRAMIDSPHDDDSPCEDLVWMAVDSVLNDVLNGIEAALDLE